MTLGDRMNEALVEYLVSIGVSGVTSAIEETANTENTSRVICRVMNCAQLAPHLAGVFKISGEVIGLYSADADDPETGFRSLCTTLKNILGDRVQMEVGLPANQNALKIFNRSWHLDSQTETAGKRGFQVIYSWRATATDTNSTN